MIDCSGRHTERGLSAPVVTFTVSPLTMGLHVVTEVYG